MGDDFTFGSLRREARHTEAAVNGLLFASNDDSDVHESSMCGRHTQVAGQKAIARIIGQRRLVLRTIALRVRCIVAGKNED